jgi:hypothetical protein
VALKRRSGVIRGLTVHPGRDGARVAFAASGLDLSLAKPPFVVRVDVGNDSATTSLPCDVGATRITCTPGS